jgi:hypothetical protein
VKLWQCAITDRQSGVIVWNAVCYAQTKEQAEAYFRAATTISQDEIWIVGEVEFGAVGAVAVLWSTE